MGWVRGFLPAPDSNLARTMRATLTVGALLFGLLHVLFSSPMIALMCGVVAGINILKLREDITVLQAHYRATNPPKPKPAAPADGDFA